MPITNDFLDWIVDNMLGESTTPFDNANAHIGVGNSDTSFNASQSDLQGTSERGDMRSGYPDRDPDNDGSSNKQRYSTQFGQNDANFRWEEWGIFNASSGGTMMNREVEYIGEKTDKVSWVFDVDVTLNGA